LKGGSTLIYKEYIEWLTHELKDRYTPPHVPAGNDWLHCDRMEKWGCKIAGIEGLPGQCRLDFNMQEYEVACWLHNIDAGVEGKKPFDSVEPELRRLLAESPFDDTARERIIDAVRKHSKLKDEPGDSYLLTALRIADKLDRLGEATMGIIAACSMRGIQVMAYDPAHPFGYTSTVEGKLKSIYNDFMRQLEWYGMLPSDEARGLVPLTSMRFYVEFVRRFAVFIVNHHGGKNLVEKDLIQALGKYHRVILPKRFQPGIR
jgi:hypothetical protein